MGGYCKGEQFNQTIYDGEKITYIPLFGLLTIVKELFAKAFAKVLRYRTNESNSH